YPAFGKRVLQDNGSWFQCLRKPNVELVRTGIMRIVPQGIETTDGTTHPVDVICYATGFKHNQFVAFDMIGRRCTLCRPFTEFSRRTHGRSKSDRTSTTVMSID
ncbi:MAG: hypothetical protein QMC74_17600, partial [Myxococcota bacterium]